IKFCGNILSRFGTLNIIRPSSLIIFLNSLKNSPGFSICSSVSKNTAISNLSPSYVLIKFMAEQLKTSFIPKVSLVKLATFSLISTAVTSTPASRTFLKNKFLPQPILSAFLLGCKKPSSRNVRSCHGKASEGSGGKKYHWLDAYHCLLAAFIGSEKIIPQAAHL